ncbi:MAG: U32 family peptidase [Myxococcota bacterium]|nr:U32 family peptidase [Myxococcota bacterium]
MTEQAQRLTMPADFKLETLAQYGELNQQHPNLKVRETYGHLNPSPMDIATGRSANGLPEVKLDELAKYVGFGHRLGIGFNYTINAPCTGNLEFTSAGRLALLRTVGQIMDTGITHFTLANPALIQLLKGHFPQMEITVSTIAQVDSAIAAKAFEDMGASRIVIAEDINRQFYVQRMIKRLVKIPLEIIVNTRCFYSCPYRAQDYNLLSHLGNSKNAPDVRDYYKWICTGYLLSSPIEWLKMRWLRPEDLGLYKEITWFKVIGRHMVDRSDLARTARTWMEGSFDGNLLELLGNFSSDRTTLYPVRIDNKKLEGFTAWFAKNQWNCVEQGCDNCNHCERFLHKAVDPGSLQGLQAHVDRYRTALTDANKYGKTRSLSSEDILMETSSLMEEAR